MDSTLVLLNAQVSSPNTGKHSFLQSVTYAKISSNVVEKLNDVMLEISFC